MAKRGTAFSRFMNHMGEASHLEADRLHKPSPVDNSVK